MSLPGTSLSIRPARPSDSPALSRVCLLTGDAGKSAEVLLSIPELVGLFYACPYVHLPYTSGFVLVRRRATEHSQPQSVMDKGPEEREEQDGEVVGYVLFAHDTRAFEDALERDWFPSLRITYPKLKDDGSETMSAYNKMQTQLTKVDKHYISLLHAPNKEPDACVAFSPAHLHVNILPEAQRQGWGRRLIDVAVRYLRDEKGLTGVWLGMDPKNTDAARFYERLGFQSIEGAPSNYVGLKFDNWTFA